MMTSSPSLLVDLISSVYRAPANSDDDESDDDVGDEQEEDLTEEEREAKSERAENAYRLLSDWAAVPGLPVTNLASGFSGAVGADARLGAG